MKALFIVLLSVITTFTFSQNVITWKGGAPGNENNWFEPKNWDKNIVPDQDDYVIIKRLDNGHYAQPIIKREVTVASIELQSRAMLTIHPSGTLILDGSFTYSEGIHFFGGQMLNQGILHLQNIDVSNRDIYAEQIEGNGKIYIDDNQVNEQYAIWRK